ncbi:hypothetical protein KY358_06005 [Candidatus Woesearchaeota archaeon]|nr:hypothetical protein [Candidatus Woesearchaeota archaeon]
MAGEVSKNNEDSLKKGSTPRLKKKGSQHMPYGSIQNNSLLSIDKIRKANQEKIAGLVRPAGYYNQKAERLKIIAGFLSKNKSPTRQQLLGLNGVGPETADSILLYAFNKPSFVIDAYTKRIFGRLGYSADDYDGWQRLFMESLPEDTGIFSEYHALLVELGKNHCKNKPLCKGCPLTGVCGEKRFHKI